MACHWPTYFITSPHPYGAQDNDNARFNYDGHLLGVEGIILSVEPDELTVVLAGEVTDVGDQWLVRAEMTGLFPDVEREFKARQSSYYFEGNTIRVCGYAGEVTDNALTLHDCYLASD